MKLTKKDSIYEISYEYLGLKEIPTRYFGGMVIEVKYSPEWYEGREVVKEENLKKRLSELEVIVNDSHEKKYRNISYKKLSWKEYENNWR